MTFVTAGAICLGQKNGKLFDAASKSLKFAVKTAGIVPLAVGCAVVELLRCFADFKVQTGLKPLAVILLDVVPKPVERAVQLKGLTLFHEWMAASCSSPP